MKRWLVDTNILLDTIGADAQYGPASRETLSTLAETDLLVINPIIFAEVGACIETLEELEQLLSPTLFHRETIPWEAAYLAGQAYFKYRRRGGKKKRMLADFLIGAHAAVAEMGLISRDQGYTNYFKIEIIDPSI